FLLNSPSFMGSEMPRGGRRLLWNVILVTYLVVLSISSYFGIAANWEELQKRLNPPVDAAIVTPARPEEAVEAANAVTVQHGLMPATFRVDMQSSEEYRGLM